MRFLQPLCYALPLTDFIKFAVLKLIESPVHNLELHACTVRRETVAMNGRHMSFWVFLFVLRGRVMQPERKNQFILLGEVGKL